MYDRVVTDVTGFILAGGKSTRMGRDKAFLPWEDETLLSHACKLAGAVAAEVRIVGDAKKFAGFGSVVEDVYRDRGPLAGIHAALTNSATELNLLLAGDLPFISTEFLQYLVAQARESSAVVTVPQANERWQPLCAVYRREFAAVADHALRDGNNKIDPLFAKVTTRVIDETELARAGFSHRLFRNLNTPGDLEQAKRGIESPRT